MQHGCSAADDNSCFRIEYTLNAWLFRQKIDFITHRIRRFWNEWSVRDVIDSSRHSMIIQLYEYITSYAIRSRATDPVACYNTDMLDIRYIRENPDKVQANARNKGYMSRSMSYSGSMMSGVVCRRRWMNYAKSATPTQRA